METGHEIVATTILSLPLIQVGQLAVSGKRMCTYHLGSLPRNSVVRLTDRLDRIIVADWDVKPQIKRNSTWPMKKNVLENGDISMIYPRNPNNLDNQKIAVIILKFEQYECV